MWNINKYRSIVVYRCIFKNKSKGDTERKYFGEDYIGFIRFRNVITN